jgi:hypothetical protein
MRTWILGRFDHEGGLVKAADKLRSLGYSVMEAFMPYPSHAVLNAVKPKPSPIPYFVLVGGFTGFAFGYLLQWYCGTFDYPINIGGRDIYSPSVYVPILFECVVLFSVLTATLSVFVLSGLPQPYHPFFTSEGFNKASTDAFILAVDTEAKEGGPKVVSDEMNSAGAHTVEQIDVAEAEAGHG